MLKKIIFTTYIIIIGIACSVLILSNSKNSQGLIQFGNTALVKVETDMLEPKIVTGDLVLADTKEKNIKEKDIISYITLINDKTSIQTNEVAAMTTSDNKKIYSLKRSDGTIENIDSSCIIGKYKSLIPYLGTIIDYLLTKRGFWTITLTPAILLFIYFLINFTLPLRKRP